MIGHHMTEVALLISLFLEKAVTLLSPDQLIVHVSTQVPVKVPYLCLFPGHSWVLWVVSALAALWSSPHWSGGVWSTKVLGQFPVFSVIIISDNGNDGWVIKELLLVTVCWEGKEETCQDYYMLGNLDLFLLVLELVHYWTLLDLPTESIPQFHSKYWNAKSF